MASLIAGRTIFLQDDVLEMGHAVLWKVHTMRIEHSRGSQLKHGSLLGNGNLLGQESLLGRQNENFVGRRVRILILLGSLAIGLSLGCEPSAPEAKPSTPDTQEIHKELPSQSADKPSAEPGVEQVVSLQIRVGTGSEPIESTTVWTNGMTVFDALIGLSPTVAVESTGQGESLFVKSIAGQANLGSAGDNWIYRVNGKLGDCSCAVYELEAGDTGVWSFGKYE